AGASVGAVHQVAMAVTAEVVARFEAPAVRVWEYVRWENLEQYVEGGYFSGVVYDERRAVAGATRTLSFPEGPPCRERLEVIDEADHHYVYRLIDSGPMPVMDYVGDVRITPAGPDACCLKVSSTCSPVGIENAEWVKLYTELQTALFEYIAAQLRATTPR